MSTHTMDDGHLVDELCALERENKRLRAALVVMPSKSEINAAAEVMSIFLPDSINRDALVRLAEKVLEAAKDARAAAKAAAASNRNLE